MVPPNYFLTFDNAGEEDAPKRSAFPLTQVNSHVLKQTV